MCVRGESHARESSASVSHERLALSVTLQAGWQRQRFVAERTSRLNDGMHQVKLPSRRRRRQVQAGCNLGPWVLWPPPGLHQRPIVPAVIGRLHKRPFRTRSPHTSWHRVPSTLLLPLFPSSLYHLSHQYQQWHAPSSSLAPRPASAMRWQRQPSLQATTSSPRPAPAPSSRLTVPTTRTSSPSI